MVPAGRGVSAARAGRLVPGPAPLQVCGPAAAASFPCPPAPAGGRARSRRLCWRQGPALSAPSAGSLGSGRSAAGRRGPSGAARTDSGAPSTNFLSLIDLFFSFPAPASGWRGSDANPSPGGPARPPPAGPAAALAALPAASQAPAAGSPRAAPAHTARTRRPCAAHNGRGIHV